MYLLEGFEALGTLWYIEVFESVDEEVFSCAKDSVCRKILDFERTYSRFREDSLLSVLNRDHVIAYDKDMASMLCEGNLMTKRSGGIFDLFIAGTLVAKGYGQAHAIGEKNVSEASSFYVTEDVISLQGNKSIDLGGIGKGYLIDCLAKLLREEFSITQFLINGGGDMYATSIEGKPVEVFLQHPKERGIVFGSVYLMNQSLCASSSYVRSWKKEEVIRNHFVTPDGKEVWAGSFVVAPSATVADMLATVLCIRSDDEFFCKDIAHEYNAAYLVYKDTGEFFGDLAVSNYA